MSYLIDTHTLLWYAAGDARISGAVAHLIRDDSIEKWLSIASAWEIAIKASLGRLTLNCPLREFLQTAEKAANCRLLPIEVPHLLEVASLPQFHRDPFDRLLIAQARVEGLTLVTADREVREYDVPIHW